MAAQKNTYDNLTQELIRQASRIEEQYANLNKMFSNVALDLEGAANQIYRTGNAPELGEKVSSLSDSLYNYIEKAKPIFDALAKELNRYANDTISNIENLKSNVDNVKSSIDAL